MGDPPPEAWSRAQRYASWIRQTCLDERWVLGEDTLPKLRRNSPTGGWFPALQDLRWCIEESNLSSVDLFLSPHLTKLSISTPLFWHYSEIPQRDLPAITSTFSALPTSALQSLCVSFSKSGAALRDPLSSVVLRCGTSLTKFISTVPLSDAAVDHLIQLPRLHTCHLEGPPPSYPSSHLPSISPLTELALEDGSVREWLSLFNRLGASCGVRESLKFLKLFSPTIDTSFTSPIRIFRNLVDLSAGDFCKGGIGDNRCTFKLDNDNVTELAMALTQLETLVLGYPCSENVCATTIACLLPISIHCVNLQVLAIHFNTTDIVGDIKNISDDPQFQELLSRPRCKLPDLYVDDMPLALDEPGFEIVANGMINIFPSMERFGWTKQTPDWEKLSKRIRELRECESNTS